MRESLAMRRVPRVKSVMTPFPYSVAPSASLDEAQAMMQTHGIHHLPVCDNHLVVGVVSERGMRVALAMRDDRSPTVEDVYTREVLLADLEQPLDDVVAQMAERSVGAAVVMRGDKLAGILTTTDVCRLYVELLRELGHDEDDEVA
jgi:acetoin utilization protein AcuB